MASNNRRHAVRGKKRKSVARPKGNPRTPAEFVDLRKEFLRDVVQHKGDPKTWPFLLQHLEASKAIKKLVTGPREIMSEAFVRDSIARHFGTKPEDVTRSQIRDAVADLLPYYPAITVIPTEPIKDTRDDPGVAKDSTGIRPRKHGPSAKMEFHRAVAAVVHSFEPRWKEHLDQIASKLDKHKPDLQPSEAWAKRNPSARSWKRAAAQYPDLVLKKLDYSLKMAAKEITG